MDKIDTRDIRDVFNKLPFKSTLSFEDCLYYLLNAQDKREEESSRRREVINWILETEQIDDSLIESYRDNPKALWRNGKGQKSHISSLYVIHPDARQQRAIFSGDEHVMITNMFPLTTSDFERVCEIFKIKCLRSEDFVPTPINKEDETVQMMRVLKPRILVLAAIENAERYKEIYNKYNEIISRFRFLVCEKIDLAFDTIHNDVERIYNDDSHVYYVNSWLHNRTFTKFCSKIKSLLGISVYDNICEDVLDGAVPVEESIEKYCSALLYDKVFRTYLDSLDCSVEIEEEEEPEEKEQDYYTDPLDTSEPVDGEHEDEESEEDLQEDNDDGEEGGKPDEINKPTGKDEAGGQPKTEGGDSASPKLPREPHPDSHSDNNEGKPKPIDGRDEDNHGGSLGSSRNGDDKPKAPNSSSNGSAGINRIPDEYVYNPDQGENMAHPLNGYIKVEMGV